MDLFGVIISTALITIVGMVIKKFTGSITKAEFKDEMEKRRQDIIKIYDKIDSVEKEIARLESKVANIDGRLSR